MLRSWLNRLSLVHPVPDGKNNKLSGQKVGMIVKT